jgi:type II secretory ATPase GspE/PulE/Tfp pilus assembly ATPase PilB-like protein
MSNLSVANKALMLPPRVLSAPGEHWELPKEQREIMALTEDGTLFVSGSHQNDLHVMAFCDRLERSNFHYQVELADLDHINRMYKAGIVQGGETIVGDGERVTHNQAEVIKIIRQACEQRASDIHFIVAHDGKSKIRFRIDSLLNTFTRPRFQQIQPLCSTIYQSMCDVAESLFQPHLSQDARVSKAFVDQLGLYGARVSTRPRADGFIMVLRLLYNDASLNSLEDLGYLPEQTKLLQRMMRLPYGINILSGPTGSGKSMTLKVVLTLLYDPALLTGMINQSLLPKLCQHCKQRFVDRRQHLDQNLVERIDKSCTAETVYVRGPGCDHCRQTGFSGRSVVAEVLMPNLRFMRVFRERGPAEARNYWVQHMAGITKHAHAIRRINEGLYDPAAAEIIIGPLDMDLYVLDPEEAA